MTDDITRTYFSIGDVAKSLSVSTQTIRNWERDLEIRTHRGVANRRKYTVNEVSRLATVAMLSKYCHLPGIKEIMRLKAQDAVLAVFKDQVKEPVMKIA